MDIGSLIESYREQKTTPTQVVRDIYARIRESGERPVWFIETCECRDVRRLFTANECVNAQG